jgi:nucleoside-diphosphate-sugar epimerase
MLNGNPGERYIITGFDEDCRYMKEMLEIIAEVCQEKEPDRKIKVPSLGIGYRTAWFFGAFLDFISIFRKKPFPIGRSIVKVGSYPGFFSHLKAEHKLGYQPSKTFRQAVEDLYDYYKEKQYLDQIDRIGV